MERYDKDYFSVYFERYRSNKHDLRRLSQVLELLRFKPEDRILDLGCGIGFYSREIENLNSLVVGVDFSIEALKCGKKEYRIKNLVCADILKLPFRDKSFDKILLVEVVEHIEDQDRLFSEINRVLKADGELLLTTSPIRSYVLFPLIQRIRGSKLVHKVITPYDVEGHKHVAIQHPHILRTTLRRSGFEVIKERYFNAFHMSYFLSKTNIQILRRFYTLSILLDRFFNSGYFCNDLVLLARKVDLRIAEI